MTGHDMWAAPVSAAARLLHLAKWGGGGSTDTPPAGSATAMCGATVDLSSRRTLASRVVPRSRRCLRCHRIATAAGLR